MRLTVVGTGYVGLVSGVGFSELGHDVVCIDNVEEKIEALKQGIMPIYEPGLDQLVEKNVKEGRLNFSTKLSDHVKDADLILIAVGTPPTQEGQADLSYVYAVADELALLLDDQYKIIVNKSTVPIGTAEAVYGRITDINPQANIDVCSVPEFLREGSAVRDTFNPDRVVIGSSSDRAKETLVKLHKPLTENILTTNVRSSEMIKYAANAFLATKISFINEIANICDLYDANILDVAKGVGLDKRIGPKFLNAGLGYGGSCFPKDVRALTYMGEAKGYEPRILKAIEDVNNDQKTRVIEHLNQVFNGDLKGVAIGVLGLAFKPETDDMRDAPSLSIISRLQQLGAKVKAFDPIAMANAKKIVSDIDYCDTVEDVFTNADAVLLITEWAEFAELDYVQLKSKMHMPVIIDGRNFLDAPTIKSYGFIYHGIGRK